MIEDFVPFFCLLFVSNLMAPVSRHDPETTIKQRNVSMHHIVNQSKIEVAHIDLETTILSPPASMDTNTGNTKAKEEDQEAVEASTYPTNQDDGVAEVESSTYPSDKIHAILEEVKASTYPGDQVTPLPEYVEASTYPSS